MLPSLIRPGDLLCWTPADGVPRLYEVLVLQRLPKSVKTYGRFLAPRAREDTPWWFFQPEQDDPEWSRPTALLVLAITRLVV